MYTFYVCNDADFKRLEDNILSSLKIFDVYKETTTSFERT